VCRAAPLARRDAVNAICVSNLPALLPLNPMFLFWPPVRTGGRRSGAPLAETDVLGILTLQRSLQEARRLG